MFELVSSTQRAIAIQAALVVVAGLLLTAAHTRVSTASPDHRRWRYAIAWLVCTAVLAALLIYLDSRVGVTAAGDRVRTLLGAGVLSAVGLGASDWWTRRRAWATQRPWARTFSLLAIQAAIAALGIGLR